MKPIDKMTLKELDNLSARVEKARLAARQIEMDRVRAEAEKLAAASGMTIKDLFNTPRKTRKAKPRIVNPKDKTQSWGGHGPKPAWLKEIEQA